ncbi:MAG: sulfotransferase family protein [Phycisphaeraceae bacterium]
MSKDDAPSPAGQLMHPLLGADPATLAKVLTTHGPIPPSRWPHAAMVALGCLGRQPFSLAERAWVRARAPKKEDLAPPIFILGHWRSGTTHLYNILGKSPRLGFVPPLVTGLPWDFLLLGRLLRPFLSRALPEERFIDRIPVRIDSPQEDEAALANMQSVSFYHGLYFPRRLDHHVARGVFFDGCTPREIERWENRFVYLIQKLAMLQPGRQIVIKNPVYTARVAQLRRLFPEAKFIHIHRDPYRVFLSMRNFYERLASQLGLQKADLSNVDELILRTYERMMQKLLQDTQDLPADRFVELRYDELDDDPLAAVGRVYGELGIDGWADDRPRFESYLASVASYRKNRYEVAPDVIEKVGSRWQPLMERWGYRRPTLET